MYAGLNVPNMVAVGQCSCLVLKNHRRISTSAASVELIMCISYVYMFRVFPRNNKVWAHGPMSLKFDGPFL